MKQKKRTHRIHQHAKRHFKLWFVPHTHNKYQPHLVRGSGIALVVALVFIVQGFYNFSNTGSVLGVESNLSTKKLLELTNAEREKSGSRDLTMNEELATAATFKARHMLTNQYWSHTSPKGVTPWRWLDTVNYEYSYAGENLARNFHGTEGVVNAWMRSDEHRKNMLRTEYTEVGFGVASGILEGKETTLVVAFYGTPKATSVTRGSSDITPTVLAATDSPSLVAQLGGQLQSMTPAALGSIILLLFTALVAATAHLYRQRLPNVIQRSWLKHHGLYKAVGMVVLAVVFVGLYGGGQI